MLINEVFQTAYPEDAAIGRMGDKNQKGVQQIMGGHVLESFRDEMLRKGQAEGREEERQENYRKLVDKVMAKVEKGKSVTQIADELEEPVSVIQPIYDELLKEEK